MHAEIVSVGTEILMGEIVDTNSAWLASNLAAVGIELRWVTKVGDDPQRLFDIVDRGLRRSDITLTTGGLGPTSDDLTRETIASALGEEMAVQEDLLEHLKRQFAGRGMPMPESNLKQATLIPSAETIANPLGTAPGWWVEKNGHVIVAMPGPPVELQHMWTREVAPRLRRRNSDVAIVTRTLKTFGISEGGLNEMVAPLFGVDNPYLGIYSKEDGIHLRAIASAPTEEEAWTLIEPVETKIRNAVGDAIWGEDDETPDTQVASLLLEQDRTLGVMESFTGGLLAAGLTGANGAREFFLGGVVVQREDVLENHGVDPLLVRKFSAASKEVAEALAVAARRRFGADVGIGVSGVSDAPTPSGDIAGTCYFGYAIGDIVSSTSGHYPARRLRTRARAMIHALLGLSRLLKGQEAPEVV